VARTMSRSTVSGSGRVGSGRDEPHDRDTSRARTSYPASSQWAKLGQHSNLRRRRGRDRRLPMHRKEVLADLSRILCRAQAGTETRSRLSRAGPPAGAAAAGPTCRYSGARSFALLPGRLLPFAGSGRSGFCSARTAPSRSDPDIRGSPRPGPGFRVDLCPRMSEQATSRGQLHRVRPGSPDTPGRQPAWSQPASPSRRAALSLRILGRISGLTSSSSKSRNQRSGVSSG
jgi:hypothetical protein